MKRIIIVIQLILLKINILKQTIVIKNVVIMDVKNVLQIQIVQNVLIIMNYMEKNAIQKKV